MKNSKFNPGTINWLDLTTGNAEANRNFYAEVAGWKVEPIPMKDENGNYEDYVMKLPDGTPVAGICHHRGVNTGIPPLWIMYISVEDLPEAIEKAKNLGGKIIKEHKAKDGSIFYAMIEDPSGAIFGLAKTQF